MKKSINNAKVSLAILSVHTNDIVDKVTDNLNVSKVVCDHLFTEKHSEKHRMGVGLIIIIAGVLIADIESKAHAVKLSLEAVGFAIHALGTTPFIERVQKSFKGEMRKENSK